MRERCAFRADQFNLIGNVLAHERYTGPEIWDQTDGRVTHFVASPGTGGTISGAARYLKEKNPAIRVIGGDPEGSVFAGYSKTGEVGEGAPYKVEGIGYDFIPDVLDRSLIDRLSGATAVITGNVGPNAFQTLAAAGVKIYLTYAGTVQSGVERLASGKLSEADKPSRQGHG